jgi:hypothetical protein
VTFNVQIAELGKAMQDMVPPHGVIYVPLDTRIANNVVDIVQHVGIPSLLQVLSIGHWDVDCKAFS